MFETQTARQLFVSIILAGDVGWNGGAEVQCTRIELGNSQTHGIAFPLQENRPNGMLQFAYNYGTLYYIQPHNSQRRPPPTQVVSQTRTRTWTQLNMGTHIRIRRELTERASSSFPTRHLNVATLNCYSRFCQQHTDVSTRHGRGKWNFTAGEPSPARRSRPRPCQRGSKFF